MGLPITLAKTLATADDDGISLSQTPLAAGDLTITGALATGGVADLGSQRRVILTFAADETGHTFVVYGTQVGGAAIQETIAGTTAGIVSSTLDFLTVTRISISAAATGALKAGTNGVGATRWLLMNYDIDPFAVGFVVGVTGTVNYTVQFTDDDPQNQVQINFPPNTVLIPTALDHPTIAAQTTSQAGNFAFPCRAIRCLINSGSGSIRFQVAQAGIRN